MTNREDEDDEDRGGKPVRSTRMKQTAGPLIRRVSPVGIGRVRSEPAQSESRVGPVQGPDPL